MQILKNWSLLAIEIIRSFLILREDIMWIVTVMKIGNVTVNKHITGKHIYYLHTKILRYYSLRQVNWEIKIIPYSILDI